MTENKRFTWNSKEVVIDDNVTGNQLEVMDITEIDILIDLLNEQNETIQRYQTTLEDMLQTERTAIGQSVLRQLQEAIK